MEFLGVFVSGKIDLHDGHGCDQQVETNSTMSLEIIFMAWRGFWNEATLLATDKNPQVKFTGFGGRG